MTTSTLTTLEAKEDFSELINRVSHHKERIILTRREKEVAVVIPIEDYALLLTSENKHDLHDATEALKEARHEGSISLDDLKNQLGS